MNDDETINLIWIDLNIDINENLSYQNQIDSIQNIVIFPFKNIKEAFEKMTSISFQKTIVIINETLIKNFFQMLQNSIRTLKIIPEILIFSQNNKLIENNEYSKYYFYDKNLIFSSFQSILNEIKLQKKYTPKKIPLTKFSKEDPYFTFQYINNKDDLKLPLYYQNLINIPNKDEILKFNIFLLDKFSSSEHLSNLINQTLIKTEIPIEIISKFWLRVYSLESYFYSEMNNYLIRRLGDDYDTYTKVLYEGLKLNAISPFFNSVLFRGAKINDNEIEMIKKFSKEKQENLPGCICFCNSFFSSTNNENIAFEYMKSKTLNDNENYAFYIIEKGNEIDKNNASNANIKDYSFFSEDEILFFPFSSFEFLDIDIKEKDNFFYYEIHLFYLGKYKEIVDDNLTNISETIFSTQILKTEFFDKKTLKSQNTFNFDINKFIQPDNNLNYIIAVYNITKNDLDDKIQFINCNNDNKNEIENSCEMFLNGMKIDFSFDYKFEKEGEYTLKIIFNKPIKNMSNLFYECTTLIYIDLTNFITNLSNNMKCMFYKCTQLNNIDLLNFNTSNVTDMSYMFYNCSSLFLLDLTKFNINKVTDINHMFSNCSLLNSLDLSNFNTSNVINMSHLFSYCSSIQKLDLSNFKTEKVTNMSNMFSECELLNEVNLSSFNTNNVIFMNHMFSSCSSLINVDLKQFNTSNVINMKEMFSNCISLKKLDLGNFKTENVVNMSFMFYKCSSLEELDISQFNISKANIKEIFSEINKNCKVTCNDKNILTNLKN